MCLGYYAHSKWSDIDLTGVPREKAWWVFSRAFFGVTSAMFCFAGIYLMPLSLAVVLYYTQPISASLINLIFNDEPLSALQVISILSAMLGVVMLTSPTLLIPSITDENSTYRKEDYPHFNWGVVVTLSASVCSGFAYLSMRKIGMSVHPVTNTFYFGVLNVQSCFALSAALKEEIVEPLTWASFGLLMAIGFFGWIA